MKSLRCCGHTRDDIWLARLGLAFRSSHIFSARVNWCNWQLLFNQQIKIMPQGFLSSWQTLECDKLFFSITIWYIVYFTCPRVRVQIYLQRLRHKCKAHTIDPDGLTFVANLFRRWKVGNLSAHCGYWKLCEADLAILHNCSNFSHSTSQCL